VPVDLDKRNARRFRGTAGEVRQGLPIMGIAVTARIYPLWITSASIQIYGVSDLPRRQSDISCALRFVRQSELHVTALGSVRLAGICAPHTTHNPRGLACDINGFAAGGNILLSARPWATAAARPTGVHSRGLPSPARCTGGTSI
jgi:hypothetical protein